ncbi:MAG TPA: Crp/Fnr family transcriptional regulator [Candidatus Saccharimonadales bacterium]|nr:Crp/Fnr family transcriptional regulator [Candidatus Saccharimonadales bacterium]
MAVSSNYLRSITKLFEDGRVKTYPKNQLINYQGDPLTHIHMLRQGYVKSYTILDSGDTRTIMILGPGDIFPLAFSASLDWDNYTLRYFYQTLCDTEIISLTSDVLRQSIEGDADMMHAYMDYLSSSNQAIMGQLEVMKNKKAIDKVTMLLPYLVDKAGKRVRPGVYELQLKLSHQEMADLSGVTRETMTTLVKELEKKGIVNQSKNHWVISTKKLESIAETG